MSGKTGEHRLENRRDWRTWNPRLHCYQWSLTGLVTAQKLRSGANEMAQKAKGQILLSQIHKGSEN